MASVVSPLPVARRGASKPVSVAELRDLSGALSPLVARAEYARLAGKTHGGDRDMYAALGYPRTLSFRDYWEEYMRGGIAERIIEAYPRATWTGGASIVDRPETGPVVDAETEVVTPFEEAITPLFRRLEVWPMFRTADTLAGVGRYAILVIGAPGKLGSPLEQATAEDLQWLAPYAEDRVRFNEADIDTDEHSPRFGLPKNYRVKISDQLEKDVHWTRVIHFAENRLDSRIYGKPVLRGCFNYLIDLHKITGGGSEAAWKRMDPGLHIDIDPTIELDETGEELLEQEVDEYVNDLRRTIRTRGTKVTPLFANVAAFGSNVDSIVELISATTGIPQRILTGSETGQQAGTSDRNNWNDRVRERRRDHADPIVFEFIDRLIRLGAVPEPENVVQTRWPDVESMDESQKARAISAIAAANQAHFLAEGKVIMTSNEMRDIILRLGPLPPPENQPPLIDKPGKDKRFIDSEPTSSDSDE